MLKRLLGFPANWNGQKFTWARGPVVARNTKFSSESSTSTRTVHLSTGGTGTIEMPSTTVTAEHEFWIRTPQGEHHVWLRNDYISVARGQTVTLIYYGDTLAAYIIHDTREEIVLESSLRKLTGHPGFWMTVLQTLIIFPVCFCVPFAIVLKIGSTMLPGHLIRHTFMTIMAALYMLCIFFCVAWLLVGYPARYVISLLRRQVLRPKVEAQVAALRGYGRGG
jgi:hypothetical protein